MSADETIVVLSAHIADMIAAGEVIERPASLVKELVENAVDAGARQITVDIESGGLEGVIVADDGHGMSPRDVRLCVLSHATSKLKSADDLFALTTLGFRGEALSSIAAVACLTMTTRRAVDAAGTRIVVRGGELISVEEIGCAVGTTVAVTELFYNTPARRKFLKSVATEQAHIVDTTARVILGTTACGAVVRTGTRRLLDIPESTDLMQRVKSALGDPVGSVVELSINQEGIKVRGFLGSPDAHRADSRSLWLFVNGRCVRDRLLQRAVLDGYGGWIERGRYPLAVVFIEVNPAAVDVNVHPQKSEVRFGDSSAVFRVLSRALATSLAQAPWQAPVLQYNRQTQTLPDLPLFAPIIAPPVVLARTSHLTLLGPAAGHIFLARDAHGVWLFDVQAMRQRVAFERLQREGASPQSLLFPEIIDVSPSTRQVMEKLAGRSLVGLGFEMSLVGPGRVAVTSVPVALVHSDVAMLARELLETLEAAGCLGEDGITVPQGETLLHLLRRLCRHARGPAAGETSDELNALLGEVNTNEDDLTWGDKRFARRLDEQQLRDLL